MIALLFIGLLIAVYALIPLSVGALAAWLFHRLTKPPD